MVVLLKDIPLMVKLTKEIVNRTSLPVTVKTRIGWDHNSIHIVDISERLQDVGISAISIHGRTRTQMYKGEANWNEIAKVKNNPRLSIPVFANGDINTPEKVKIIRDEYGFDGAMIGRASIGNPWFFNQVKSYLKDGSIPVSPSLFDRVKVAKEHLKMAIKWKGETLGVLETRRHYSNYFRGIPNFKQYRTKIVTSNFSQDVFGVFDEVIRKREEFVLG